MGAKNTLERATLPTTAEIFDAVKNLEDILSFKDLLHFNILLGYCYPCYRDKIKLPSEVIAGFKLELLIISAYVLDKLSTELQLGKEILIKSLLAGDPISEPLYKGLAAYFESQQKEIEIITKPSL